IEGHCQRETESRTAAGRLTQTLGQARIEQFTPREPTKYGLWRARSETAFVVAAINLSGGQAQLSKLDLAVITLEHDRPRRTLGAIECTAGDAGYGLAVDDLFAVQNDGDCAADECDLDRLPFACLFRGVLDRGEKAVDTADFVAIRLVAEIILDLHFVA